MSSYLGVPPQSGFITTAKQRITSSTNNYVDLDHSISSLADVIVFVNFVKQDYTNLTLTTSSRITLGATLVASDIVEIAYLGKAVATQSPPIGGVSNDMLAGSIADAKITGLSSSKLTGVVPTANLGSGTASSSTVLFGDQTYKTAPSGALTFLSSTDLSSGVTEFIDTDFFTTYSSYKHFIFDVQLICPSSNADLRCVFQDGSGDVAGNIQASWVGTRNNASDERGGINTGSNSNGVTLFQTSASNNGDAINGTIEFWQPVGSSNGDINMKWSLFGGQAQQSYWLYVAGGGTSASGNNATGFVIKRASGALTTSGNYSYIKVYGVQST